MKKQTLVIVVLSIGLVSLSDASASITKFENFDTDPGWSISGNGVNGNSFGYRTTSFAGGNLGEAGGRFTRSEFVRYYADLNLNGSLDLDDAFGASGRFDYTAQNRPDYGRPFMIGHFSESTLNVGTNMIGFDISNGGTVTDIFWTAGMVLADGTDLAPLKTQFSGPNNDILWSYAWDPNGGIGFGEFSLTVDGQTKSIQLTQAQRQIGLQVDGFGFFGQPAPGSETSQWYSDVYIDDVSYSANAVPEPSSLMLFGLLAIFGFGAGTAVKKWNSTNLTWK